MLDARFWTLNSSYQLSRYSPSQLFNDLVCVCQIVEQKIWRARLQSLARPTASRNRNGPCAKCVSIVMVIRESAEFKEIPETVMLKLEPCALLQIPGQKGEHNIGLRFQ